MWPGHSLAKRNQQQQTGMPRRMPTSACASPGKAEGGKGRPPPEKKRGGARERPTASTPPTITTRGGQTLHPACTKDRTPRRRARGPASQNRQHQAESSGPAGGGTPKTRGHTPRWDEKKQTTNNAAQKLTQIRYASLLANKWFIERLGNRSSAGRQQTGRPGRRRRKRGRAIPVPASDHRKKGMCRPQTVQCKYLVCFYAFYYCIPSSLYFAAQNL